MSFLNVILLIFNRCDLLPSSFQRKEHVDFPYDVMMKNSTSSFLICVVLILFLTESNCSQIGINVEIRVRKIVLNIAQARLLFWLWRSVIDTLGMLGIRLLRKRKSYSSTHTCLNIFLTPTYRVPINIRIVSSMSVSLKYILKRKRKRKEQRKGTS